VPNFQRENLVESPSRVASIAAGLGLFGVFGAVLGPIGAMMGVIAPMTGFAMLGIGVLSGALGVIVGLGGLWTTRSASGRAGRGRALTGMGLGLLLVIAVGAARSGTESEAQYNDITTDLSDPPMFTKAQQIEANLGRDFGYPKEFEAEQRQLYPDLAPIAFGAPPAEAFRNAEATAESLGWEITYRDAPEKLEATQTSNIFRFVDDIVIRIRPNAGGSTIDIRSKSRDGRSDLGINAKRIRAFRDALGTGG
jgi:uncharacterized protein (DUF1499 family)